jgi:ElaB protein
MSSTNNASSQTVDDLKALLHDAEQALAGAGTVAEDKIAELRDRMRAALDKGTNAYNRARECAQEKLGQADDYVRSHPYQSIGTGIAIGAIIGLLIGRRLP